jgi:hypothetical protein
MQVVLVIKRTSWFQRASKFRAHLQNDLVAKTSNGQKVIFIKDVIIVLSAVMKSGGSLEFRGFRKLDEK